jgi:hypothetical protein
MKPSFPIRILALCKLEGVHSRYLNTTLILRQSKTIQKKETWTSEGIGEPVQAVAINFMIFEFLEENL